MAKGGALYNFIATGAFPETVARRYFHHLISGLSHMHSKGVYHRDLKPDNIGWTADGVLKLFDFGLASCVRKQVDCTETYALTGNTGTLRYMAPEVALGLPYNQSVSRSYEW